jgi:NAD(P)-dependent dehydrogenase (short-subunit alcohol dehydrogenase family)
MRVISRTKSAGGDARSRWPRLDAVFINAGDVTHALLEEWQEEAWDRLMRINLKGPFFLIQALLPLLNNPSSVILCGSVSARIGLPTSSVYAASKAGLLSLARTLSAELLPRGIRVNGLSPGPVETPAFKTGLSEEAQKAMQRISQAGAAGQNGLDDGAGKSRALSGLRRVELYGGNGAAGRRRNGKSVIQRR